MKIYQPQKNNPYILPRSIYNQTLWLIRDYDRLKREYHDIIDETPYNDGQPRGTNTSDPTAQKAIKLESVSERLKAIEQAEIQIPEEYRKHVLNNVLYGTRYPLDYANKNTWSIYRCRFINFVAKNMKWI